ncbi:hypothetical protein O7627_23545 [Solwaraspora sp. WMMD1047]|uniref:hypothetical protein n=1 Tax=Solwaraspora sp. WMMD1047 TaxID=3016102 RepID=UPI00241750D2|nr:hypothetical protein [Solwaraspora sp. WMMD1047]MDG4832261.1 hypothetical protein [Solwaraspora sp. WMMD1047]
MRERELHCETCRGERRFEMPPCADGHGADCLELACAGCGSAILIGVDPLARQRRPRTTRRLRRHTAPGRRLAA